MREPFTSRLLFPLTEHAFTYGRLDAWLGTFRGIRTVTHAEVQGAQPPFVALRHDVDSRLDSAVEFGRLEHARGVRATFFVLSTAPYYRHGDPALAASLRRLQDDHGHEIGWHNDLVTLEKVRGVDPAEHLERELEWLRGEGLVIRGSAPHGSPWCHRLGFHNNYVFAGWDEPQAGFPNTEVGRKLDPSAFGLEYDAYHLPRDAYFSDSRFTDGRRWHPEQAVLEPRTLILLHPCHWDASPRAKWLRLTRKVMRAPRRA